MWEFWRSKLSKGKTRHKRRDLDTGSDDDSPSTARSLDVGETLPGTSPENSSHGIHTHYLESAPCCYAPCARLITSFALLQCTLKTSSFQLVTTMTMMTLKTHRAGELVQTVSRKAANLAQMSFASRLNPPNHLLRKRASAYTV